EYAVEEGAIVPGEPEESFLIERIYADDKDEVMPPPKSHLSLSEEEKDLLKRWIAEGAKYEKHWSFMSLDHEYEVPDFNGLENQIDRIVLSELKDKGIEIQGEARKTSLLRRVYFDLIGLPPTPEEVRAFLADSSEEAYGKVVDGLLSRPEYGERMAVDWLDLARYADTYGHQVDQDSSVWRWRDWVIDSFNENLPYDEFVTYQLAGDLLPEPTLEQRLATAFNRLHQQKSEGGSVEEEFRVEYVNDRVNTFGTAFLGLTMECARCHDHKYDPISQKDYYQLFAFFDDIDEAGLYSYFGNAVPTPALSLLDESTDEALIELAEKEFSLKRSLDEKVSEVENEVLEAWLKGGDAGLTRNLEDGNSIEFLMDKGDEETKVGKVEFDGDVEVKSAVGEVSRHDSFSLSFSVWASAYAERNVICHYSVAWTDAASRGWELLAIDGKLRFSLIHFWPGNAISVEALEALPEGEWAKVTVSYDGSSRASGLKIYLDGAPMETRVLRDSLTKSIQFADIKQEDRIPKGIMWGARFRDRGFAGGKVKDAAYFDRELHPIEVAFLDERQRLSGLARKDPEDLSELELYFLKKTYAETQVNEAKALADGLQAVREERGEMLDAVEEIMTMAELDQPKKAYVLERGAYDARGEEVFAATPEALSPFPEGLPRNRLGLARWLTAADNPLFARVTVNRFWMMCFGRGLVDTAEDFGLQGEFPHYQNLLDFLAVNLMENDWDVKALMKMIVTSRVYRQNSLGSPDMMESDPANKLLARGPRHRLSAEMIRDSALAAGGLLRKEIGGKPARPYDLSEAFVKIEVPEDESLYRRSLYTYWKRRAPSPLMMTFDAVKRDVCSAKRQTTNTPLQSLALLNGPQFIEAARAAGGLAWDEEGGDLEEVIRNLSLRFISREPDEKELLILKQLFHEQKDYFAQDEAGVSAILNVGGLGLDTKASDLELVAATLLAQTLMNFDESVVKR
ncbi:MAG: DUF1553 domain-containing protein, partial [Verrucomicrobiota bacterium]